MHPVLAFIITTAAGATAAAANNALDVGLVFPRQNETFAPNDSLPFVIAIRNASPARYLKLGIEFDVYDANSSIVFGGDWRLQPWMNYTSEPYLLHIFGDFRTQGNHVLKWQASWLQCDDNEEGYSFVSDSTERLTLEFSIAEGGKVADLVVATANITDCSGQPGVAINVTGELRDVTRQTNRPFDTLPDTCAVVVPASPTVTPDACRVRIDQAMLEDMWAQDRAQRCATFPKPSDCPSENRGAQSVAAMAKALILASGLAMFTCL